MEQLSARLMALSPSATLAMSQKSQELKAQGLDIINLSVGEPDFNTPDHIKEAAKQAVDNNFSFYTAVPGYLSLREAISKKLKEENGVDFAPTQIVVGNGAKQEICNVILAVVDKGDEVIIPTPAWVSYFEMVKLAEGVNVPFLCGQDQDFKITAAQLESLITPKTKVVLLCSPSNPTGAIYTKEELAAIAQVLAKYPRIIVIADEIHADLTLPNHHHTSYSTVSPEAKSHSITFIAPSKTFNIAGLGSSISYTPSPTLRSTLHSYLDTYELANGNIFAYIGAEAAFLHGEDWLAQMLTYLQGNIDHLGEWISAHPAVKGILPQASYLAWLDFTPLGLSHQELKDRLINRARVALNAGTSFGGADYECCFRINLGCPRATLCEALSRIENTLF